MIINYLKIAIAVLRRRKFFTIISLFGISFTLMILIILTAYIEKVVGDNYPDKKRSKSLYITRIEEYGKENMNSSGLSYYFIDHFVKSMKTPVNIAICSGSNSTNTYVNNKKITLNYKYTDASFWDVMEYEFLDGKAFDKQQVNNSEKVVVISEDFRDRYFGENRKVIGQYIEADNVKYRVTGVFKNVPITNFMAYSDIFLPFTVSKANYRDKAYQGNYTGILLANSNSDLEIIQSQYDELIKKIPMEKKEYNRIYSHAETYLTAYLNNGNEGQSGVATVSIILSVFVFLFLLLPTLNLININITRIMERSSEIGVRKAFGASSKTLAIQFIVENIILTLLGGFLGLIFSFIALSVLNNANIIPNLQLSINFSVLLIALFVCVFFGILSGVYPAWRMSKLDVVNALKFQ